ncbi:hypothetical protein KTAU_18660 [Thermogemmatispora aurantia]|uniref:HTH arsR-type domain-containing protein n=1 Tax=Thermogemmatispora aurantia TaxID=2045279 RepID=A0A5J4K917_9CHLR|nr:metalloregulator ArsR/SmtB family transcription factor [Thermogemmatispora aurantia]GER83229.1 hypothetical protein KTAU_18660 [Thermogemmatispora aurantia]
MDHKPVVGSDVRREIALAPVYNALNSLALLCEAGRLRGLNAWVERSAQRLTAEQRQTHKLIFSGLRDVLVAGVAAASFADFATYLEELAGVDPENLRDRALQHLRTRCERRLSATDADGPAPVPSPARLIAEPETYLACAAYADGATTVAEPALLREAHRWLNQPAAMQELVVQHLRTLWQKLLEAEWRRVQPILRWQVEQFSHYQESAEEEGAADLFLALTGRELPTAIEERAIRAERLVLVPSWHMGRHVSYWEHEEALYLFFSEPPNYDVALLIASVGQAELRARLAALADETRLRLIELLAERDELTAQELITALGLSQSNVSRHLKQLVSLGFLYESRASGAAKAYRLSSPYFVRTARALKELVSLPVGQRSTDEEAHRGGSHAPDVRRFLDRQGRLCLWPPAKLSDKQLVLSYLASFFEAGRRYSEQEVNAILDQHSAINDSAALRRALCEYRFLERTRDGTCYWLVTAEAQS